MEKIQTIFDLFTTINVGELILFKKSFLNGKEYELFGVNNDFGSWVSLNDITNLLDFGKNTKKRIRRNINDNDKCMFRVERFNGNNAYKNNEEYFVRDTVVYDIIMKDREERSLTEQFIFDVLSQLNGDLNYDPELDPVKEEIINEFRNDIYACEDITEVEWNIKMVNKYEMTEEERKAKYKRAKDMGLNTNAPVWIKDIVR